jgi:CspA family cold shock protein
MLLNRRVYAVSYLFIRKGGLKKLILQFIIYFTNFTMDTKIQGTVKFFNEEKGFGFIKHDNSNKETFVHANGLIDQIEANDKVEFDVQEGRKGLNAVNVKRIS